MYLQLVSPTPPPCPGLHRPGDPYQVTQFRSGHSCAPCLQWPSFPPRAELDILTSSPTLSVCAPPPRCPSPGHRCGLLVGPQTHGTHPTSEPRYLSLLPLLHPPKISQVSEPSSAPQALLGCRRLREASPDFPLQDDPPVSQQPLLPFPVLSFSVART